MMLTASQFDWVSFLPATIAAFAAVAAAVITYFYTSYTKSLLDEQRALREHQMRASPTIYLMAESGLGDASRLVVENLGGSTAKNVKITLSRTPGNSVADRAEGILRVPIPAIPVGRCIELMFGDVERLAVQELAEGPLVATVRFISDHNGAEYKSEFPLSAFTSLARYSPRKAAAAQGRQHARDRLHEELENNPEYRKVLENLLPTEPSETAARH